MPRMPTWHGGSAKWPSAYRREKALDWLGREMPAWPERCPLHVKLEMGAAGGATTFTFGMRGNRPVVTSQRMEIRGDAKQTP